MACTYTTTAAVLLAGLAHAQLGHPALRLLLQLQVDFLYQLIKALLHSGDNGF
jgi:hypothetical protein